jgi:rhodanese-related sulfurtransferase
MPRRLRLWAGPVLMCAVDASVTLLGQAATYWAGEYSAAKEANPLGLVLLWWHPAAFAAGAMLSVALYVLLIERLSQHLAKVAAFLALSLHSLGAASWFVQTGPAGWAVALGWLVFASWLLGWSWREPPAGYDDEMSPERDRRRSEMAAQHSPRFLALVKDAKTRVRETTVDEVKARLDRGEKPTIIDVREESEYARDHVPGAVHMGKGVLERDIEAKIPDPATELILYCGGGFRSALAADALQKMGYTNVISMDGGMRDWRAKGYPLTAD